jgi:hypothetical protein
MQFTKRLENPGQKDIFLLLKKTANCKGIKRPLTTVPGDKFTTSASLAYSSIL